MPAVAGWITPAPPDYKLLLIPNERLCRDGLVIGYAEQVAPGVEYEQTLAHLYTSSSRIWAGAPGP
jgi:hypothetical protein